MAKKHDDKLPSDQPPAAETGPAPGAPPVDPNLASDQPAPEVPPVAPAPAPPPEGAKRYRVTANGKGGIADTHECWSVGGGSDAVAQAVQALGISDPSKYRFAVEEV